MSIWYAAGGYENGPRTAAYVNETTGTLLTTTSTGDVRSGTPWMNDRRASCAGASAAHVKIASRGSEVRRCFVDMVISPREREARAARILRAGRAGGRSPLSRREGHLATVPRARELRARAPAVG